MKLRPLYDPDAEFSEDQAKCLNSDPFLRITHKTNGIHNQRIRRSESVCTQKLCTRVAELQQMITAGIGPLMCFTGYYSGQCSGSVIRDILEFIRIRGSVPLTNGSGPCSFRQ
jgi:hypothetical protein